MPLRKAASAKRYLLAGALAATAMTTTMTEAASAAALSQNLKCAAQTVSSPFAQWGDLAQYWLAPGGDFETAAKGWALKNAKVVNGNENLGVLKGSKSLQLGGGLGSAEATTPPFCADPTHPHFRFVAKNSSSTGVLKTYINFRTATGVTLTVTAKLNTFKFGSWQLSSTQPLASEIPSIFMGTGTTASITFKATTVGSATINIDNVLVDPYRRG